MRQSIQKAAGRVLARIVPEASVSAVYCSCEPGHWWCVDLPWGNTAYCEYLGAAGCRVNYTWTLKCGGTSF